MKVYTGIGSRKTPESVTDLMSDIAVVLYDAGYTLRSGRAEGADYAFQRGAEYGLKQSKTAKVQQEIYIPNSRFNKCFGRIGEINPEYLDNYDEASDWMYSIHPKGQYLRGFAREAHIRNVYQVLGLDLKSPSNFLICWTPLDFDGEPTGGTATAWKLAKVHKIPSYNLFVEDDLERLQKDILELANV